MKSFPLSHWVSCLMGLQHRQLQNSRAGHLIWASSSAASLLPPFIKFLLSCLQQLGLEARIRTTNPKGNRCLGNKSYSFHFGLLGSAWWGNYLASVSAFGLPWPKYTCVYLFWAIWPLLCAAASVYIEWDCPIPWHNSHKHHQMKMLDLHSFFRRNIKQIMPFLQY